MAMRACALLGIDQAIERFLETPSPVQQRAIEIRDTGAQFQIGIFKRRQDGLALCEAVIRKTAIAIGLDEIRT